MPIHLSCLWPLSCHKVTAESLELTPYRPQSLKCSHGGPGRKTVCPSPHRGLRWLLRVLQDRILRLGTPAAPKHTALNVISGGEQAGPSGVAYQQSSHIASLQTSHSLIHLKKILAQRFLSKTTELSR